MFTPKGRVFILLAVSMAILMNISQKYLINYSSYSVYVVATSVGLLVSLLGYFFLDSSGGGIEFSPWMIVLGVAVALLNFAYIRIYQTGAGLSWVPLVVTVLMTVGLVVIGTQVFNEQLLWNQILGAVVILAGLFLMVWR